MAEMSLQPTAVEQKENATSAIIPFDAHFDNINNQEVPDFDLVSILDEVEKSQKTENAQGVATSMMSNQVVNNIPKSLFHNCTIQNITFNMKN